MTVRSLHTRGRRKMGSMMDVLEELGRLAQYADLIQWACVGHDLGGSAEIGEGVPEMAGEIRDRLFVVAESIEKKSEKWAKRSRKARKRRAAERAALPLTEGDTLRVLEGPHVGTEAVVTKAYDGGGEVVLRLQPAAADGAGDGAPVVASEALEVHAEITPAAVGTRRAGARTQEERAVTREAVAPLAAVLAGPPPPTVGPADAPDGAVAEAP